MLDAAVEQLGNIGIEVLAASRFYRTKAVGPHQPDYLNMVLVARGGRHGAAALLRRLKHLERAAGRRSSAVRWTARCLDIDIVSFNGQRFGWPNRRDGTLTLPHPLSHARAFVLVPLLEVAPHWHHAGLRAKGRLLLASLSASARAGVRLAERRPIAMS